MKITGYGSIKPASGTKRRDGSSSVSSFSDLLGAGEADGVSAPQLSDIAASTAVGNVFAMQEITEQELVRKKIVERGHTLLDELETLRRQLLLGSVPLQTLRSLHTRLSAQRQMSVDPVLHAIMDDIELRAAVETAKLEMAAKATPDLPIV